LKKKKQKTFFPMLDQHRASSFQTRVATAREKSFLVLFFKKGLLASLTRIGHPVAKKIISKKAARKQRAPRAATPDRPALNVSAVVLDRLWSVVLERRDADPQLSHSARLLSRGTPKVAQKFGEEAVECIIEAVAGNREALIAESADVIYHLLVLWVSAELHPSEVWAELERREGVSGIAEKAARRALMPGPVTKKIP